MKLTAFLFVGFLFFLPVWTQAQTVPPPPVPIAEADLRDNSIKMRSIELERVKRDAKKVDIQTSDKESELRFAAVKEDFEKIQKLQESIVRIYTTGKRIDYKRIGKSAGTMAKNAERLDSNLFGTKTVPKIEALKDLRPEQKSVRTLIIQLDNAIGNFVESPVFKDVNIVDLEVSKKAQTELEKIYNLSKTLSNLAGQM